MTMRENFNTSFIEIEVIFMINKIICVLYLFYSRGKTLLIANKIKKKLNAPLIHILAVDAYNWQTIWEIICIANYWVCIHWMRCLQFQQIDSIKKKDSFIKSPINFRIIPIHYSRKKMHVEHKLPCMQNIHKPLSW